MQIPTLERVVQCLCAYLRSRADLPSVLVTSHLLHTSLKNKAWFDDPLSGMASMGAKTRALFPERCDLETFLQDPRVKGKRQETLVKQALKMVKSKPSVVLKEGERGMLCVDVGATELRSTHHLSVVVDNRLVLDQTIKSGTCSKALPKNYVCGSPSRE